MLELVLKQLTTQQQQQNPADRIEIFRDKMCDDLMPFGV